MPGFTAEIRSQLRMYSFVKRRSFSSLELFSSQANHSNNPSRLDNQIPISVIHKNNNKVYNGDNVAQPLKFHRNSMVSKISRTRDPFELYLKMIKQLRFNRRHQLRSVSCQSENKHISLKPKTISANHELRSQSCSTSKKEHNPKHACSPKSILTNSSTKNDLKNNHMCAYYQKIQDFLNDKPLLDESKLEQNQQEKMESLIKTVREEVQRKYGNKDMKEIDKILLSHIVKSLKKTNGSTKAIQVKADTKSKAVNINPSDLMTYYICTLTDFITTSVTSELINSSRLQISDNILHQNHKNIQPIHSSLKIQGDCELNTRTEVNKLYRNPTMDDLNGCPSVCHYFKKSIKQRTYICNDFIEHLEDHDQNSRLKNNPELVWRSSAADTVNSGKTRKNSKSKRDYLTIPFTNVPQYSPDIFCDSNMVTRGTLCQKETPKLVKQIPVRDISMKIQESIIEEKTCVSESSTNKTSFIQSISTVEPTGDNVFHSTNFSRISMCPMQMIFTITTVQPMLRNDTSCIIFSRPSARKNPIISIENCSTEADRTSGLSNVSDLEKSDNSNQDSSSQKCDDIKVDLDRYSNLFNEFETLNDPNDTLFNCNQSQSYQNNITNVCVKYTYSNHIDSEKSDIFPRNSFNIKHVSDTNNLYKEVYEDDSLAEVLKESDQRNGEKPSITKEFENMKSFKITANNGLEHTLQVPKRNDISLIDSPIFQLKNKTKSIIQFLKPDDSQKIVFSAPKELSVGEHFNFHKEFFTNSRNNSNIYTASISEELNFSQNAVNNAEVPEQLRGALVSISINCNKYDAFYFHKQISELSINRHNPQNQIETDPFPNRCGLRSLYRTFFQPWVYR